MVSLRVSKEQVKTTTYRKHSQTRKSLAYLSLTNNQPLANIQTGHPISRRFRAQLHGFPQDGLANVYSKSHNPYRNPVLRCSPFQVSAPAFRGFPLRALCQAFTMTPAPDRSHVKVQGRVFEGTPSPSSSLRDSHQSSPAANMTSQNIACSITEDGHQSDAGLSILRTPQYWPNTSVPQGQLPWRYPNIPGFTPANDGVGFPSFQLPHPSANSAGVAQPWPTPSFLGLLGLPPARSSPCVQPSRSNSNSPAMGEHMTGSNTSVGAQSLPSAVSHPQLNNIRQDYCASPQPGTSSPDIHLQYSSTSQSPQPATSPLENSPIPEATRNEEPMDQCGETVPESPSPKHITTVMEESSEPVKSVHSVSASHCPSTTSEGGGSPGPSKAKRRKLWGMETIFECPVCEKQVFHLSSLDRHMRVVHSPMPKLTPMLETMQSTMLKRLEPGETKITFYCGICEVDFPDVGLLREHHNSQHSASTPPAQLGRMSVPLVDLEISARKVAVVELKRVNVEQACAEHSLKYGGYASERKRKVGRSLNIFKVQCTECKRYFPDPTALRKHFRKTHRGDAPPVKADIVYQCPKCFQTFGQNRYVKDHYKQRHLGNVPRKIEDAESKTSREGKKQVYECPECFQECPHKNALIVHYKRRHLGDTPNLDPEVTGININDVSKSHRKKPILPRIKNPTLYSKYVQMHGKKISHTNIHIKKRQYIRRARHDNTKEEKIQGIFKLRRGRPPGKKSSKILFPCPRCNLRYRTKGAMIMHHKSKHDGKLPSKNYDYNLQSRPPRTKRIKGQANRTEIAKRKSGIYRQWSW